MKKLKIGILADSGARRAMESFIYMLHEQGYEPAEIIEVSRRRKNRAFRRIIDFPIRAMRFAKSRLERIVRSGSRINVNDVADMFRVAGKDVPEHVLMPRLNVSLPEKVTRIPVFGINDEVVAKILEKSETNHFVFLACELIRSRLFATGKRFILVHPGEIPRFRGKDAMIWSLLKARRWTWSGMYLNEGVDTGDLIATHSESPQYYPPPHFTCRTKN